MPDSGNTERPPPEEIGRGRRPGQRREPNSRKKACGKCSIAKVRCDLKKPHCSRCETRGINCDYTASQALPLPAAPLVVGQEVLGDDLNSNTPEYRLRDAPFRNSAEDTPGIHDSAFTTASSTFQADHNDALPPGNCPPRPNDTEQTNLIRVSPFMSQQLGPSTIGEATRNLYWSGDALNFAKLDLICPIDAIKIRNRWLGDFIPSFGQRAKNHPPSITLFISRVLKTYSTILLTEGHLPPFIHPAQLSGPDVPTPLANCFSLIRLWDGQVRGSENMVREIIRNEMNRLYEERNLYDQMNQLAAFQAYLTYAMLLFFAEGPSGQLIDRQVMINLQDFGCDIASSGLVCPGELAHKKPDWESWIVASTKRRALYTMYMFDNQFCSRHGLPTFLGEELESLLAPASKALWEASARGAWESEYDSQLRDWPIGGLRIDELWPAPETGITERRKRVDRWLASVDEFGMMLFAVTLVTHGG